MLNRLAVGLFGSPEEARPAFVVQSKAQLESALALTHQPYYRTFAEKLAALTRSIACNHGLADGNKRLAVTVLHSTLLLDAISAMASGSVDEPPAEVPILRELISIGIEPEISSHKVRIMR